jgi:hypothetical protein
MAEYSLSSLLHNRHYLEIYLLFFTKLYMGLQDKIVYG